jgi:thiosulfate dehydrogenase
MPSFRFPSSATAATLFGAALLLAAVPAAHAANPLQDAVARGQHLFLKGTFGGNGRTCETCHVGGGKVAGSMGGHALPSLLNAAAIFPRYNKRADKVVTLEDQIRHCIEGGLAGKAPAYGSADLAAMTAYLGSIAHGQKIDIGGKPGK